MSNVIAPLLDKDDEDDNSESGSGSESDSDSESEDEQLVSADGKDKNVIFTKKEKYRYRKIKNFYKNVPIKNIERMISIIDGKSKISLRKLDWFATKYFAKNHKNKKKAPYKIKDEDGNLINFNFYISYKAELDSFKKRHFDPFKRRKKFYFNYDSTNVNKRFMTTIGQLNFFRWVFEYDVLKYVDDNYDDIMEAMSSCNKKNKNDKKDSKKSKDSKIKEVKKDTKVKLVKKGVKIAATKKVDEVKKETVITVSFE